MNNFITFSLFILICTGCNQNNGNIGLLFGKWQLTSITNENEYTYHSAIFYNFQNNIIETIYVDNRQHYQGFGEFVHKNDSLFIVMKEYNNTVNVELPGEKCSFQINELTSKKMTLSIYNKTWSFKKY
ncbi:MAG: lipocalin-like domain-containing protein [Bacteroidales bacterium]